MNVTHSTQVTHVIRLLRTRAPRLAAVVLLACVTIGGSLPFAQPAEAQTVSGQRRTAWRPMPNRRPFASNVIVPQSRSFNTTAQEGAVTLMQVEANVVIKDRVAVTSIDLFLENPTGRRLESELLVPVPEGATVKGFTFEGAGSSSSATLLPRDEARRIYDDIVRQSRDPALLEFVGLNVIRSSVFPVEPRGKQRVRISYEQLLPRDGVRTDYVIPRSESLAYDTPWRFRVELETAREIVSVYSPSHPLVTTREGARRVCIDVPDSGSIEPGPFRLSWLTDDGPAAASIMAYPDADGAGGYFLLMAGLPEPSADDDTPAMKREVTLVLDRSGSMRGPKIEQVREAAKQVIAGLNHGERFNIIVYNEYVERFTSAAVEKTKATQKDAFTFLDNVQARGGTNIHDALLQSLKPEPAAGVLPIVMFLTDGLPTVGQTSESQIRDAAAKANVHRRRVFTFGVGLDVNTPLLNTIAKSSRAQATYVLPSEDVELAVSGVFRRLAGPLLAAPSLTVIDAKGNAVPARVSDVLPGMLPDVFEGDQLIVMGRYLGDKPLGFRLAGESRGRERTYEFQFKLDKASTEHSFVPRLWASRKIGELIDAIRALGADPAHASPDAMQRDPRFRELVDEVIQLSREFGVLTEYTAFFAREGSDFAAGDLDQLSVERAHGSFGIRQGQRQGQGISGGQSNLGMKQRVDNNFTMNYRARSGKIGVQQELNNDSRVEQLRLNSRNSVRNSELESVQFTKVQQISNRTFYRRDGRWVEGKLLKSEEQGDAAGESPKPDRVVLFGSPEFEELLTELLRRNEQGSIALEGDVLLQVNGDTVLVKR